MAQCLDKGDKSWRTALVVAVEFTVLAALWFAAVVLMDVGVDVLPALTE
jgi:hypothetical protein